MKRHIYHTPAIDCMQVESSFLMNAGSPAGGQNTISNGGNATDIGGTPIAD